MGCVSTRMGDRLGSIPAVVCVSVGISLCHQPTGWKFKTTYFHIDADKALQSSISLLQAKKVNTTYQDSQVSSEIFSL